MLKVCRSNRPIDLHGVDHTVQAVRFPLPTTALQSPAGKRPMSTRALPLRHRQTAIRVGLLLLAAGGVSLTGCQVDVGGQTLPSGYYLQDDIQYFPAGPEFKLSKEAAALKAYKKELGECPDGCGGGGCSSCK